MGYTNTISFHTKNNYADTKVALKSDSLKALTNNNDTASIFTNGVDNSNSQPQVCYAVGCHTNPVTRVSATINQNEKDKKTDNAYKNAVTELMSDVKNNKISKEEFYTKFTELTENDLKTRISKAIPQVKQTLNKEDINNLQEIFSFEANFIHDILGAVNDDYTFTDKDKIEILQKMQANNEKLWANCSENLPALDMSSQIEYAKCFTLLDKSIRITAASIINNSKTLNETEKAKSLNIFGNTAADRKNIALQNENKRINTIIYQSLKSYLDSIYPNSRYYNDILSQ